MPDGLPPTFSYKQGATKASIHYKIKVMVDQVQPRARLAVPPSANASPRWAALGRVRLRLGAVRRVLLALTVFDRPLGVSDCDDFHILGVDSPVDRLQDKGHVRPGVAVFDRV